MFETCRFENCLPFPLTPVRLDSQRVSELLGK